MPAYRSLFSYYGSKSKLSHLYPAPEHDTIIEPFAGSAAYSFLHHERQVILNDVDERTLELWRFLLSPDALDIVREYVRPSVEAGTDVRTLPGVVEHPGLLQFLRAEGSRGTYGTASEHNIVTPMGRACWHRIRPKMEQWLPRIRHWQVREGDYRQIDRVGPATWFVDPPYNNVAGRRYRHAAVDFVELAAWCRSRQGTVIVCENEGADWLPFVHLRDGTTVTGAGRQSVRAEVVAILRNPDTPVPTLH